MRRAQPATIAAPRTCGRRTPGRGASAPSAANSIPYDINEHGQVVGESSTLPGCASLTYLHALLVDSGAGAWLDIDYCSAAATRSRTP